MQCLMHFDIRASELCIMVSFDIHYIFKLLFCMHGDNNYTVLYSNLLMGYTLSKLLYNKYSVSNI